MDKPKRYHYTSKREAEEIRAPVAPLVLPMDILVRYKSLPRAERMAEVKAMLLDVFRRLEEHGGTTSDELRQVAEGIVEIYERKPRRRLAASAK